MDIAALLEEKKKEIREVAPHRLRSPLDISLAKRELGWAPTIYLEEGIARLAHWLLENKPRLRM